MHRCCGLGRAYRTGYEAFDFTLPDARTSVKTFGPDDLVVFGTPVYAGRVPNVLVKYLHTVVGGARWPCQSCCLATATMTTA